MATLGFKRDTAGAFQNSQQVMGNHPDFLHLLVGLEVGNRNAGVKQEITVVARGAGFVQNALPEVVGANPVPATVMPGQLVNNLVNESADEEAMQLNVGVYGALMMAAGQDSDHTGHSCGAQPTRHGQTLMRIKQVMNRAADPEVTRAAMGLIRVVIHTGKPSGQVRRFKLPQFCQHGVFSTTYLNLSEINLRKFIAVRVADDLKYNGMARVINSGTIQIVLSDLMSLVPSRGRAAFEEVLDLCVIYGAFLGEQSSVNALGFHTDAILQTRARRYQIFIRMPEVEDYMTYLAATRWAFSPTSELAASPVLFPQTVIDRMSQPNFVAHQAKVATPCETSDVGRLLECLARPPDDGASGK